MEGPRYLRFVRAIALSGVAAAGCADSTEPVDAGTDARDVELADARDATPPDDVEERDTRDVDTPPDVQIDFVAVDGPLAPPDLPRRPRRA